MIKRENYLSRIRGFYDSNLVKILTGIRRCGKSIIISQIIDELKTIKKITDDHIIFVNFEFIEFEELLDYKKLNKYVKDKVIDNKIYYVFLDEIQNVDNFEKVVNSLRASIPNISIFITGSNSKLLSTELSTELSGRYVEFYINPFSYKEYIELTKNKPYKEESFNDYTTWGGLSNVYEFKNEIDRKNYLHNVFDSIILRDVIIRLNLKDTRLFNSILQYLIETTGREFSSDNILKYLKREYKEVSTETLYTYLDALCKSFIIRKVYRYDIKGKNVLKTLNKYYVTDLGISSIKNNNPEFPNYIVMENIVYNELINKGYEVYVGKTSKGEIDFLAIKDKIKYYIQVTYKMDDEETSEREYGAFDSIDDSNKYLIYYKDCKYTKEGVINLNLIDFLLNDEL